MSRKLANWLERYIEYTALSEAPEMFHFWTGVSTIAGALRRRVRLYEGIFEWVPNFYIVFVAPPGVVTKSTTMRLGTSLLQEVEGIHFGPVSCTWQALGQSLQEAQELVPEQPGNLESKMNAMACITCHVPELGTFLNFQDDKLISVLTALWDGQKEKFEHKTATQGKITIENPWVNILAATTPYWLHSNTNEGIIGGGLASRMIFVFGEKKRHLVAYPGLLRDREEHEAMQEELIHDLKQIAQLQGDMLLTPEAIEYGQDLYINKIWGEKPIHMASERFDGYRARKQGHIHKLAMVLAISRGDDLVVEREDLETANKLMEEMEYNMISVFESIGVTPMARLIQEIISFIFTYQRQNIPVNRQMLWRHCMQIMPAQEFAEACDSAIKAGYLEIRQFNNDFFYKVTDDLIAQKEAAQ